SGTLEITPVETPLALFVWSKERVVPVRVTDFSVTEEAFDPKLNPTRAKVSLSLRVLSVDDLGFSNKGGSLYMIYQQNKERLAQRATGGTLALLGLTGIPGRTISSRRPAATTTSRSRPSPRATAAPSRTSAGGWCHRPRAWRCCASTR